MPMRTDSSLLPSPLPPTGQAGRAGKLQDLVDSGMLLQKGGQSLYVVLLLKAHHQAQVPALHLHILVARQSPEDGLFQAALQHGEVARASHAVEDGARQANPPVKIGKAQLQGPGASRHAVHIDDQQNWNVQDLGHLSGAGDLACVHAVEEAHHPFHHGHISSGEGRGKAAAHTFHPHHEGVEVTRRAAADSGMVRRVDEVRADLEGLHLQSARAQRSHEAQGNCGLTHTAVGARDEDGGNAAERGASIC